MEQKRRYILWTTVKHSFVLNKKQKKKNFGLPHIYNYICMHHTETESNHDGHLSFYLLLLGFRIIKILVLIS